MEIPKTLAGRTISLDAVEEGRRLECWCTGLEVRDLAYRAALRFDWTSGHRFVLDQVLRGSTARSEHKRATTAPWPAGSSPAAAVHWSIFDTSSSAWRPSSYEVVATEGSRPVMPTERPSMPRTWPSRTLSI